jgi:hypothetical protein
MKTWEELDDKLKEIAGFSTLAEHHERNHVIVNAIKDLEERIEKLESMCNK